MTDGYPGHEPAQPRPGRPGGRITSVIDWWLRDRTTGRIVIGQFPNVALWIFIATVVLSLIVPAGTTASTVVAVVGVAALGWWSVDEMVRGVNPWRRLLGLVVFAVAVASAVALFG